MKKRTVTIIIILAIILFSIWAINRDKPQVSKELAECIGKNSVLYMRTGCFACKTQEDLFKENLKYLTIVDCLTQGQKCSSDGISSIPTWIINGSEYAGVQDIQKLKSITGC